MAARNSDGSISWNFFEKLPDDFIRNLEQKQKLQHVDENVASTADGIMVPDIVNQLGMAKYYPNKLPLQTVIAIRDDMFSSPIEDTDVPWVILRQIIAINFNFRDKVLDSYSRNQPGGNAEADDDDDGSDESESDDSHSQGITSMNPLDIVLAIYQCCDPFLQQIIAQKMYMCRLAIPIVYQCGISKDVSLLLWPLRGIETEIQRCTVTQAWKTLSFMKVGYLLKRSKSKLINELLRDQSQEHNTFFHRDCPLGMNNRTFSNGTVETTWYLPGTDKTGNNDESKVAIDMNSSERMEQINCPVTVFNLRGNAALYEQQKLFLLKASTVIALLVNYEDFEPNMAVLSTIHQSDAFVILVTDLPPNIKRSSFMKHYQEKTKAVESKMQLLSTYSVKKKRQLNSSEIRLLITQHVSIQLEQSEKTTRLADIPELFNDGIMYDEGHNTHCVNAKANAEDMIRLIGSDDQSSRKAKMLSLQGKEWLDWSKTMKKQKRSGEKKEYDRNETLHKEMIDLRLKQVEQCNAAPAIFSEFVRSLLIMDNDTALLFFLSWVRQYFDKESRTVLPKLVKQLHDAFKYNDQNRSKATEKAVKDADIELANASLGIEHMFREMGQVYEAFMYSTMDNMCSITPNTLAVLQCLPVTVAKLLLLGLPLELMDGDAAFVPMKWLKSVFDELGKRLGKKKVCAISTLGIQSSGKSTLLNTMFGLQFAVRAGRCTRGLYTQILPVDRRRSTLPFDYVMIIDTEGLRAPELAGEKIDHDNELALLVMGLADVVLVNIKGETIADMENILQMVVHGLLRLQQANNKLKLQQNSVLVHQNVSAQDAGMHLLQGQQKTVQNLDEMTREVATQMQMGEITEFKQVINFNPLRNIKYVCDLWQGCPPMAPSNPNYSANVVDLARNVLYDIAKKKKCLGIHEIFQKLENLWDGILTEDFIFSFRNCLEVKAYSMLERKYQQLVWEKLEEFKLGWCNQHIIPQMTRCNTDTELDMCEGNLKFEFNSEIRVQEDSAIKVLKEFFDSSDFSDIMIHWREFKLQSLTNTSTSISHDVEQKIRKEKERCRISLRNGDERTVREKEINEKATKLANSLKGSKPSSDELTCHFETMWSKWYDATANESLELTRDKEREIERDIMNVLYTKYKLHKALIEKELVAQTNVSKTDRLKDSIAVSDFTKEHLNPRGWTLRGRVIDISKAQRAQIHDSINAIFSRIDDYIDDLFNRDEPYEKTEFSRILNIINEEFETQNDPSSPNEFTMTDVCRIKVAVHVANHSVLKSVRLNKEYEKKHSVQAALSKYKPVARQLFDDIFEAKSEEIIASNSLCVELDLIVRECITKGIPLKIKSQMKANYTVKYDLIVAVMRDLAENEDFDACMHYVQRPDRYVKKWLTQQTKTMVFHKRNGKDKSLYMEWIEETLSKHIRDIVQKAKETDRTTTLRTWIDLFREELPSIGLAIPSTLFQHVAGHSVQDINNFVDHVVDCMHELEKKLFSEMQRTTPKTSTDINRTADISDLFDSLWGCCEKCPLCYEPCKKSLAGHENSGNDCHSCIQHRPEGMHGCGWKDSNKLAVESCSYCVQSTQIRYCGSWCGCSSGCRKTHPYRNYKEYMKKWDIESSSDMSSSKYWIWLMTKYNQRLADRHGREPAEIPDSWKKVKKSEALDSLTSY